MKKPVRDVLSKQYVLPKSDYVSNIVKNLSPSEKIFFWGLVFIFILSTISLVSNISNQVLVEVPADGGNFIEGVVVTGSPRYINPLLAKTEAGRDLSMLVYSGLMRATSKGDLMYDLAKQHTVSEDGLRYTFILKDDIYFHDGEPVTADDIVFTIKKAQDSILKSPKRASWDGVLVEKINDKEILFTLNHPYTPFLQNMTLGILPHHIWGNVISEEFEFSQFNIEPIGSGPFKIKKIKRDSSGIPEYYDLVAFNKFVLGEPNIKKIRVQFYTNENFLIDAYIRGEIDSVNSISTKNIALAKLNAKEMVIKQVPLPRIFGIFFNQNQQPLFANIEVRSALDKVLDKERIINEVLDGYATAIDGPIPPGILPDTRKNNDSREDLSISRKKTAIDILDRNGWKVNEDTGVWEKKTKEGLQTLSFSISTSDNPELKAVAEIVKEEWESIGAKVDLKIFAIGDLNQNVIRQRNYDSLLFGEIVGRELDLFAFWHSSQRNDPGLNIALYANITVDSLLEDARTVSNGNERLKKFTEFEEEISNDFPAIFIYSPDFIYIVPEKIKGIDLGLITTPSERFLNIHEWFIEVDSVWSFFAK